MPPEEQYRAMVDYIGSHKKNARSVQIDQGEAEGTTPRQLTDLIGSLCDLTSGSGDKGTPIVFIQSYFKKFGE